MLSLDRHAGSGRQATHPPPCDAGADPVRGLQRVEAAAGTMLTPAEREIDPGGLRLGVVPLGQEATQRLLHAGSDRSPELTPQRSGVLRDLALNRRHDLLGELRQLAVDRGRRRWM